MTTATQLKLFNLYKGMTIKQVEHRLLIADIYTAQRQLAQRVRLVGMVVGD